MQKLSRYTITFSNIDNPLHIPVELQLLWTGTVRCIAVLWILCAETGRVGHQIRLRTVQRHPPLLAHRASSRTILRLGRPEHCKDYLRSRRSPTEEEKRYQFWLRLKYEISHNSPLVSMCSHKAGHAS